MSGFLIDDTILEASLYHGRDVSYFVSVLVEFYHILREAAFLPAAISSPLVKSNHQSKKKKSWCIYIIVDNLILAYIYEKLFIKHCTMITYVCMIAEDAPARRVSHIGILWVHEIKLFPHKLTDISLGWCYQLVN